MIREGRLFSQGGMEGACKELHGNLCHSEKSRRILPFFARVQAGNFLRDSRDWRYPAERAHDFFTLAAFVVVAIIAAVGTDTMLEDCWACCCGVADDTILKTCCICCRGVDNAAGAADGFLRSCALWMLTGDAT